MAEGIRMAIGIYKLEMKADGDYTLTANGSTYTVTAATVNSGLTEADCPFFGKLADYAADDTDTDVFSHTGVTED